MYVYIQKHTLYASLIIFIFTLLNKAVVKAFPVFSHSVSSLLGMTEMGCLEICRSQGLNHSMAIGWKDCYCEADWTALTACSSTTGNVRLTAYS